MIRLITTIASDHTQGGDDRRRVLVLRGITWTARIHPCASLPIFFFFSTCVSGILYFFFFGQRLIFPPFLLPPGYLRELSCINVGLNITAMTGKLAEKLPLTMSSLINTIPDSLYPEEDIPTSMNIFTNTESISHYSQMNTGKSLLVSYILLRLLLLFFLFSLSVLAARQSAPKLRCAARGRQQLSLRARSTCLRVCELLRTKADCRV